MTKIICHLKVFSISRYLLLILFLGIINSLKGQVADFAPLNPTVGCLGTGGVTVLFENLSTGATSYLWDFGNGNTSNSTNSVVTETYTIPGTYTVVLTANSGGSSDVKTEVDLVVVFKDPEANFTAVTPSSGCSPITVDFQDMSTEGDASITLRQWDFFDGTLKNDVNPSNSFTSGQYHVALTVTDVNGCVSGFQINNYVQVSEVPVINFSASPTAGCDTPHTSDFVDLSTGGETPYTYEWDFGDGNTSTLKDPSNTYINPGTFDVKLKITDQFNCSASKTDTGFIQIGNPIAKMDIPDTVCKWSIASFFNLSSGGTEDEYLWDYGDGSGSTDFEPSKVYYSSGNFTVVLKASIGGGACSQTDTQVIYVDEVIPNFTTDMPYGCSVPHEVNFTNTTVNGASFHWLLRDSLCVWPWCADTTWITFESFNKDFSKTLNQGLNYTTTLVATSAFGCVDSVTYDVPVIHLPVIYDYFQSEHEGCTPLNIDFRAKGISDSTIIQWTWDFGDGSPLYTTTGKDSTSSSHIYNTDGEYSGEVTLLNSFGCEMSYPFTVRCGYEPTADFVVSPDTACFRDFVLFEAINSDPNIDTWSWAGDGLIGGFGETYSHLYDMEFDLPPSCTLTVAYNGCRTEIIKDSVITLIGPDVVSGNFIKTCDDPMTRTFEPTYYFTNKVEWDFDDGTTSNVFYPTHTYTQSGDYTVTVTVFDTTIGNFAADFCPQEFTYNVKIRDVKADFESSLDTICPGTPIIFKADSSKDVASMQWNFDDGNVTKEDLKHGQIEMSLESGKGIDSTYGSYINVTHIFVDPGEYNVKLIVRDDNSCTDTLIKKILVVKPSAAYTTVGPAMGCRPLNVDFLDATITRMG